MLISIFYLSNCQIPVPVIVAIVVIAVIVFAIIKVVNKEPEIAEDGTIVNKYLANAKSADDIKIKEDDSKEVKVEKIQGKLELLNKEIDEKKTEIDTKSSELNKLYEEYVNIMNESQM